MTKTSMDFDVATYAPVAERVRLFYEAFPLGRIVTELVARNEYEVLFKALVFRTGEEPHPAATGWASEREGDGDVNAVACLENTETSAVGRALANLGFTASRERPSAEEMAKAARARARRAPTRFEERQTYANALTDLLRLLDSAERRGARSKRILRWREHLRHVPHSLAELRRFEDRARAWVLRHRA